MNYKLILITFLIIVVACTTKHNVAVVPEYHSEIIAKNYSDTAIYKDSVFIHDSVYVKEKGDTLYLYNTKVEFKYKTLYKYVTQHDTIIQKDSIPYTITITEYKEVNKQNWLQKTLTGIGVITLVSLFITVLYKYIKLRIKK